MNSSEVPCWFDRFVMEPPSSGVGGRPPMVGGASSAATALFHPNRRLDDDRQMFIRNLHNQANAANRRSSTGLLSTQSGFGKSFAGYTRFRRLHRLHYESLGVGLNDTSSNCVQNIYTQNRKQGLLFRASLPATPISTPIHKEFQPFTEQLLFDRLCRTPSPARRPMQWDANNNHVAARDPRLDGRLGLASLINPAVSVRGSTGKTTDSLIKPHLEPESKSYDVDELSESDIGTTKGLRLALNLQSNHLNHDKSQGPKHH